MVVCHHSSFAVDGQSHLGPPAGRGPGCAGRDWFQSATEYLLPSPTSSFLPTRSRAGGIMGLRCSNRPLNLTQSPGPVDATFLSYLSSRLLSPSRLPIPATTDLACCSLLTSLDLTSALFPSRGTCSRQLPETSLYHANQTRLLHSLEHSQASCCSQCQVQTPWCG